MNFNIIEIAGAIVAEVNRHSVQQRERKNIRREQEGHVNSLWRKREEKKTAIKVISIGIIVGSIINGNNIINGVIGSTGSSNLEEANI